MKLIFNIGDIFILNMYKTTTNKDKIKLTFHAWKVWGMLSETHYDGHSMSSTMYNQVKDITKTTIKL